MTRDDHPIPLALREVWEDAMFEAVVVLRRLLADPSVAPEVAVRAARLIVDLECARLQR